MAQLSSKLYKDRISPTIPYDIFDGSATSYFIGIEEHGAGRYMINDTCLDLRRGESSARASGGYGVAPGFLIVGKAYTYRVICTWDKGLQGWNVVGRLTGWDISNNTWNITYIRRIP
jgi:hypothetical protein